MEKGLNVSALEKGTILIIETKHSIYKLKIMEGKEILLSGGMTKRGEEKFPLPTKAIFCGSVGYDSELKIDWIGQNMSMEIIIGEDRKKILTSKVQNVTIESSNGNWNYSMDWNKI